MGKGGESSSNSNTTTTNVSGQNGISGDNLGVSMAGVNNSDVSISMTDHGAVAAAAEMADVAFGAAESIGVEALQANSDVSQAAIDAALQSSSNALDANTEVTGMAFDFGSDAMESAAELGAAAVQSANDAAEMVSLAHGENLQYVAGLAGQNAAQQGQALETLKELASQKSDGGQLETSKLMQQAMIAMVVLFVLAMLFVMVRKR